MTEIRDYKEYIRLEKINKILEQRNEELELEKNQLLAKISELERKERFQGEGQRGDDW